MIEDAQHSRTTRITSKTPRLRKSDRKTPSCNNLTISGMIDMTVANAPLTNNQSTTRAPGAANTTKTLRRRERIAENILSMDGIITWSTVLQHQLKYIRENNLKDRATILAHTEAAMKDKLPAMTVAEATEWKKERKAAKADNRRRGPQKATVAAPAAMLMAAQKMPEIPRLAATLHILTASRLQTILQLQTKEIFHCPFEDIGNTTMIIRESKTENAVDSYAVHVDLDTSTLALLTTLVQRRIKCLYLFPPELWARIADVVGRALKEVDADLTIPSIRQSALQAISISGAKDEVGMSLSRHTTTTGYRNYLAHGALSRTEACLQREATQHIMKCHTAPALRRIGREVESESETGDTSESESSVTTECSA